MAHPYISGAGNITQMISQLRRSFPQTVTSDTVKRLGIASKNESRIISILQFLGIIDSEGRRTDEAHAAFANVDDKAFAKAFDPMVKRAYAALFDLHGDAAWNASEASLVTFFRQTDRTGDTIGRRQATVFRTLAALAGHGGEQFAPKAPRKSGDAEKPKPVNDGSPRKSASVKVLPPSAEPTRTVGLTVRIEVNLPSDGTKQTYDDIFKSIRENLING